MLIERTSIEGLLIILPKKIGDHRGFFSETYDREAWVAAGLHSEFVQDNHSLSAKVGTVRGLHFQVAPFAQEKLVRVTRGCILDVVVDIRPSSPTFGRSFSLEISRNNWRQLFIPIGLAHGFCVLEPKTEVIYKMSARYSRDHERGLAWDDPQLAITWPVAPGEAILSDKDRGHPRLLDLPTYFS